MTAPLYPIKPRPCAFPVTHSCFTALNSLERIGVEAHTRPRQRFKMAHISCCFGPLVGWALHFHRRRPRTPARQPIWAHTVRSEGVIRLNTHVVM